MVGSLLYYCKFSKSLTSVGFEINPYDTCIADKTVDGTQMTIYFHVDDCFRNSETRSWEWFLHRAQDQETPK
jgi:hypothetical protein